MPKPGLRTITLRTETQERVSTLRKHLRVSWDAAVQVLLDNTSKRVTCVICSAIGEFTCESEMLESGWLLDVWSGDKMLGAVCPAHEVRQCLRE